MLAGPPPPEETMISTLPYVEEADMVAVLAETDPEEEEETPTPEPVPAPPPEPEPEPEPQPQPVTEETEARLSLMESQIAQILAAVQQRPLGTVLVEPTNAAPAPPPKYEKHYRCDAHPELLVQLFDMSALERGEEPEFIPGEYIKFRMGHLYTSDENVIRTITWLKTRPRSGEHPPMGGVLTVYEDDGGQVWSCNQGCNYHTATKAAWQAHMLASHQMQV